MSSNTREAYTFIYINSLYYVNLKGTATLIVSMFYMKDLNKPCILVPVLSKSVEKRRSCGHLNCNGSGHIVGLVTSHSLIKYA